MVLGASVLLDYVLTVAVSMSSAATFITALFPQLQGFRAGIAVTLIVVLSVVCLRGVQLMGRLAHWPLYIFLALLGITLVYGLLQAFTGTLARAESAGYTLTPETPHASLDGVFLVLLLSRSFSAGAVALRGFNYLQLGAVLQSTQATQRGTNAHADDRHHRGSAGEHPLFGASERSAAGAKPQPILERRPEQPQPANNTRNRPCTRWRSPYTGTTSSPHCWP